MAENKLLKTDDDIEQEIARLKDSYYVKLAKKEGRRQYAYQLRVYEKKGKELAAQGVTIESLDELDAASSGLD